VLYRFKGGRDAYYPSSSLLTNTSGVLFGTSAYGGGDCPSVSTQGCGTVFTLTPPAAGETAWTESVLYKFKGGSDGAYPYGSRLMADASGALYGATNGGGGGSACLDASYNDGCGTVFKLTPPAAGKTRWTESALYRFTGGSDGAYPVSGLIADSSGALYGETSEGGTVCNNSGLPASLPCGTVFKLTPPAGGQKTWIETVLLAFTGGSDGALPLGYDGLVAGPSGALYGTTFSGAQTCPSESLYGACGVVFQLNP